MSAASGGGAYLQTAILQGDETSRLRRRNTPVNGFLQGDGDQPLLAAGHTCK